MGIEAIALLSSLVVGGVVASMIDIHAESNFAMMFRHKWHARAAALFVVAPFCFGLAAIATYVACLEYLKLVLAAPISAAVSSLICSFLSPFLLWPAKVAGVNRDFNLRSRICSVCGQVIVGAFVGSMIGPIIFFLWSDPWGFVKGFFS